MRCKRGIPPQVHRPEQVMRQSQTRHPLSCFPILTVCIAMAALAWSSFSQLMPPKQHPCRVKRMIADSHGFTMGTDDADVGSLFWTTLYPLVNIQKAIENGPVEIVDFPMKHGGSFHSKMLVHQRVISMWQKHETVSRPSLGPSFPWPSPSSCRCPSWSILKPFKDCKKNPNFWQEFQPKSSKSIHFSFSWQKRTAMALVYVHFDQVLRKSSVTPCRRVFEERGKRQWNTAEPFGWAVHRLK